MRPEFQVAAKVAANRCGISELTAIGRGKFVSLLKECAESVPNPHFRESCDHPEAPLARSCTLACNHNSSRSCSAIHLFSSRTDEIAHVASAKDSGRGRGRKLFERLPRRLPPRDY